MTYCGTGDEMKPDGVMLSLLLGRLGAALWGSVGLSAEITRVLGAWTDLAVQITLSISVVLALISKIREARRFK